MTESPDSAYSTMKKIVYLLLIVLAILLIPLTAMQFTDEVQWTVSDFMMAAVLLLIAGFTYLFLIRNIRSSGYRWLFTAVLIIAFMLIWAELAVGIFN